MDECCFQSCDLRRLEMYCAPIKPPKSARSVRAQRHTDMPKAQKVGQAGKQNKTKQKTHQQHQQPCSEHVGCFPGSLLISWSETQTHQFSAVLKHVEAFFFFPCLSFFSFPSFLVLICGARMTLISASLLFIHVTSLTALHQIRLLGFRRALRRHWELL